MALAARVVRRRPLRWRGGADAALDRPAHVRAASGLTWLGDQLMVVCDDLLFLGVVDVATGLVDDVALPAAGPRAFDARRGNKAGKPDFEATFALDDALWAVGSGGPLPARQVVARWRPGEAPTVIAVPALMAQLAAALVPAGGALNLEGAVVVGDAIWLANRGGDTSGPAGVVTQDAIVRVPRARWHAAVAGAAIEVPAAQRHDLGQLAGAALRFTELTRRGDAVVYLAAAERTTSFYDDGEVVGSALGVLGGAPAQPIVDEHGAPLVAKLEGLAFVPTEPTRAFAVDDADDPDRPATLFELHVDA